MSTITSRPFQHLQVKPSLGDGAHNLGGKFRTPAEFDTRKFASAFIAEGNECLAAQQEQEIVGTKYTAQGWAVWTYPKTIPTGVIDDKTKQPIVKDHPHGGKPHKVTSIGKEGETYVLMFRPLEVQQQVNEVYGILSRERSTAEEIGETINGAAPSDTGMLPEDRLRKVIGAEQDAESRAGQSSVLHSSLGGGNHLTSRTHRVSQ